MESPPLTIRNLTSVSLELKRLERFEPPQSPTSSGSGSGLANITNVTRSFTSLLGNATSPTSAKLAENAQSFSHEDVSHRIDPFKTLKTGIPTSAKGASETLRLIFESSGEKQRLDIPTPSGASTTLVPLTPNPRILLTAIYLAQYSHLTLFSSANLGCWMMFLKDETPLSALSIPGTHNSPTCHRALPSVRCQAVGVREQLDNGVRFLDIRVQPEHPEDPTKDGLVLVHGVFPISLTGNKYFRDLVKEVSAFLESNPSETVILSVKREGPGNHTDAQLSRKLRDHYAGDVHHWFTAPHIPTLAEARKKIVLLRRFALEDGLKEEWNGRGWCVDAEHWAYNTPNDTCHSGHVAVQDFCEVLETENIDKKIKYSEEHLERAACCVCPLPSQQADTHELPPVQPLYLNFLSASNFWKVGCWPEKIAAKLNPAIVDFLCRRHNELEGVGGPDGGQGRKDGDGSTGIVVCDWVGHNGDWDLVRCIVGMNAKLELRERQGGA
ncbi:MAG: hypothetical protein M1833_001050 [Piccolia ochrophora]|nr:MAG: hypothetical protein M1833_001050 [Piccolia ochrophora]